MNSHLNSHLNLPLLLGVDCGTSVVKSVVFNHDGHEVFSARRDMPVVSPGSGASEVDMVAAWEAAAATISDVAAAVGADSIGAIGVSGTACGVWPMDETGTPVRRAILWNDGRASSIISRWQASGFYQQVFALSANAPFPGYPLSSLCWLLEHEPAVLDKSRWLLFHKDWIRYNLTRRVCTDPSDVSYFPGDIRGCGYSDHLLRETALIDYRDRLPSIAQSHEVVGEIDDRAAARTGLRPGTPVVAGAVDVVASALGGGAYQPGQACSILGTSFLNSLVVAEPAFEPADSGVTACMPGQRWLRSLVNTTGTLGIDWMIDTLLADDSRKAGESESELFERVEQTIHAVPPGADGLIFLPYLNTAGMVSPFAEPNARAQFFGLSMEHTRAHLMRAVYEGIALAMRDGYDAMNQPIHEVLLVGGGARSAFWSQLFADVTGRRIVVPEGREFGARGAAILAGVGTGRFASFEDAIARAVHVGHVFEPRPEYTDVYTTLLDLYRHLYMTSRESWLLRRRILDKLN